jgi:hypothetical protein
VVACALLAAGCRKELSQPDRGDIVASRRAWVAARLPEIKAECLDNLRITRESDYATFRKKCANPFVQDTDTRILTGCTSRGFSRVPFEGVQYTIYIAPDNPHERSTIRHEALHVFLMCAGLDIVDNNGDALHTNPAIWKSGGDASVEARAASY